MLTPARFGKFAIETNIKLQKAFLISFSIAVFIALSGNNMDNLVGVFYDVIGDHNSKSKVNFDVDVKRNMIIGTQYLMLYAIFQYSFHFVFTAIKSYMRYYFIISFFSFGIFLIGKLILDFFVPVGAAFFVLYSIDRSDACFGCLGGALGYIGEVDTFSEWFAIYIARKWNDLYVLAVSIFGESAISLLIEFYSIIFEIIYQILSLLIECAAGRVEAALTYIVGDAGTLSLDDPVQVEPEQSLPP